MDDRWLLGISRTPPRVRRPHNVCFLLLVVVVLASYWRSLADLVAFSFARDQYSYIALIPLVSMVLVLRRKAAIFREARWAVLPGMVLVVFGLAGSLELAHLWRASSMASLSAAAACVVVMVTGSFVICYGESATRAALFPLLFLLLMVPIPEQLLDSASRALQEISCQLTYILIALAGTPVLRSGFVLSTPQGGIEVASQCSGIHSTLGLLIGSVVSGHVFLRSVWKKAFLAAAVVPVSIFKNALRIITLYWLGVHTDQRFLTGELHRNGGIPFSALALAILAPMLWALYKSEARTDCLVPKNQGARRSLEYATAETPR